MRTLEVEDRPLTEDEWRKVWLDQNWQHRQNRLFFLLHRNGGVISEKEFADDSGYAQKQGVVAINQKNLNRVMKKLGLKFHLVRVEGFTVTAKYKLCPLKPSVE